MPGSPTGSASPFPVPSDCAASCRRLPSWPSVSSALSVPELFLLLHSERSTNSNFDRDRVGRLSILAIAWLRQLRRGLQCGFLPHPEISPIHHEGHECCQKYSRQHTAFKVFHLLPVAGDGCGLRMSWEIADPNLLTQSRLPSIRTVPDGAVLPSIGDIFVRDVKVILRVGFSRYHGYRLSFFDPEEQSGKGWRIHRQS